MLTPQKEARLTAREKALQALRDKPNGMSKSELSKLLDMNPGAYRRLIMSMESKREIVITEEVRPTCGPTKVVRAAA